MPSPKLIPQRFTSTFRQTNRCSALSTSPPLLNPFADTEVQVTTLKVPCTPENLTNPNAVKVVTALDDRALYFSRATLPYIREPTDGAPTIWKHIGLYAYTAAALNRFHAAPPHTPGAGRASRAVTLP